MVGSAIVPGHAPQDTRTRLWAVSLVFAALLIVLSAALAFVIAQFDRVQDARHNAFETSLIAQKLTADLLEVESSQRGFVITQDTRFLAPFEAGIPRIPARLAELAAALKGQPDALAGLDSVRSLWDQKSAEMQRTIALSRAGQPAEAARLVADGSGKALMEAVRRELEAIAAQIAARLDAALGELEFWQAILFALGILTVLAALAMGTREILRTRSFIAAQRLYQSRLLSSNAELARLVEARTQGYAKMSALLEGIMAAAGAAIYAKDRQCRMVFANDSALQVIGRDRAQVIGRTDAQFHANQMQAEAAMRNDLRIMASGVGEMVEEDYSSGPERHLFESHKQPWKNAAGEVIGMVGVSLDVTARKQAEAERFRNEQRFRAAVTAFAGIVWTANPAGEVVVAHEQWTMLTGQSAQDAAGHGWSACLHPGDVEPTRLAWTQCLAEVRPFVGEYRVRARDGTYRTFAVRAVPVLDENQVVAEWVGLNIDITGERDMQQQLSKAFERTQIALDAAEMGAWEVVPSDPGKNLFDARIRDIWGLPPDATLPDFIAAVHADDREKVQDGVDRMRHALHDERLDTEYRIIHSGGKQKWVSVRGKVQARPGETMRIIGTARDITIRKDQQERVDFLMHELSHRTKNSLAVIQSIARQSGAKATSLESFQESFQQRLQSMAQSLDLLVTNQWKAVAIRDLIKSQIGHHADKTSARFVMDGPNIFLNTEAAQNIGLALHELSTNAAKYGALSATDGKVVLGWQLVADASGEQVFRMEWRESGGPAVAEPSSTGFGHVVIQRVLKSALTGESDLRFDPDGVRWTLVIPAKRVVTDALA